MIPKFRAWHKKEKTMLDVAELNFVDGTARLDSDKDGDLFYARFGEVISDIELMQFTGLIDKNGKEIYEGDILGSEFFRYNFQVKFLNGGFYYVSHICHTENSCSTCSTLLTSDAIKSHLFKVVGNIYENGDLLK